MSHHPRDARTHRPQSITDRALVCLRHAALLCLFAFPLRLFGAPAPLLSDYTHTAWGGIQGGPVDVMKIAQTADGWLWIATEIGLYRYDGVVFEHMDTVFGHRLVSSNVLGLATAADGALWAGYRYGGVTVFRKGGARSWFEKDGVPGGAVFHIEVAPDGMVWVAARDGIAVLAPGATRFQRYGADVGLPQRQMFQILFGRDGTQWVAGRDGVFFRRPGERRFTQAWPRIMMMGMVEAPDGTLWASDNDDRYYRVRTRAPAAGDAPRPEITATGIHFDRSGQMWLMQRDAVERQFDGGARAVPAQRLIQANGLSGPLPQCFFQDREGTIWIGTSAGLDRLRRNRLKPLPVGRDFDHPGMVAGPDGDVWIGDNAGNGVSSFDAAGFRKKLWSTPFSASYRAPDGALWIGGDRGLRRRAADGVMSAVALPADVHGAEPQALQQDTEGGLWVSFAGGALYRLAQGAWVKDGGLAGIHKETAIVMALDAAGALWMGHVGNIVTRVTRGPAGPAVQRLGEGSGLQLGTVLSLLADRDGMWAGGERGTMLFRAGRFVALHGRGGEAFRGVSGIVRLPDGDLWLHGADGIYRIAASALAAWLGDPARDVAFERFDALDGLRGHASQLRPLPSLIRAADGVLWFATGSAITRADPAAILHNPLPPPVAIVGVAAEGKSYDPQAGAVSLPEGAGNLTVAFTALSLAMPERVRLRYRLEGVDRGWQEPAGRRSASYTNLAPGAYRFQVTAANEDGVWNPAGATLAIHIAPTFVQTSWFKLLLAAGTVLLLYAAYTLRVRYLTRRMQERLHAQLEERSRIARSLHDTLLQGMQGLLMSFDAHAIQVPPGSRERVRLEQGLGLARRLLVEGRNQIMGLRASASPAEMHLALQTFGAELAAYSGHAFDLRIVGRAQPLEPRVNDEIYAIAHEALLNASRYAGAARVVLALEYGDAAFVLHVRDDGCGLDAEVAAAGGRPGHWGLPGMRERARAIGAQFRIESRAGQGTDVVVTLAGELAYPFSLRRPGRLLSSLLSRWLRRRGARSAAAGA